MRCAERKRRTAQGPDAGDVGVDDVRLVNTDPVVTEVTLDGTSSVWQIAGSNTVSDADGERSTTIFLPPGIVAHKLSNGVSTPISVGHLRATEYTVGVDGPSTMPAALPPTSGYTFAAELSLDEVTGETDEVLFSGARAVGYVDSFLDTPVGSVVPVGTYRRKRGAWTAERDGRVIRIASVTAGRADLEVDEASGIDTGAKLSALGITDDERAALASKYEVGTKLWRFTLDHFTPVELNWPYICDTPPPPLCSDNPPPPSPDGELTVAEHVEDAATLDILRNLGIDLVQGFFLGRPAAQIENELAFRRLHVIDGPRAVARGSTD